MRPKAERPESPSRCCCCHCRRRQTLNPALADGQATSTLTSGLVLRVEMITLRVDSLDKQHDVLL